MSTAVATPISIKPTISRKPGYVIALVVNVILLWLANNLLAWEWPRFITSDFNQVLPYINLSLIATMIANVIWLFFDPAWFRSFAQVGLNLITIVVSLQMYRVFPFDFTGYAGPWDMLARLVIILTIFASVIGVVAETFKCIRAVTSAADA